MMARATVVCFPPRASHHCGNLVGAWREPPVRIRIRDVAETAPGGRRTRTMPGMRAMLGIREDAT